MKKIYYSCSPSKYHKALARLRRNLESGRFITFSRLKQSKLWSRLKRYARQLGITVKLPVSAALLAGISLSVHVSGQTFTEKTGAENPLNLVAAGNRSVPTLVDIDGDGDLDAFVGRQTGTLLFYRNNGTKKVPSFTAETGSTSPVNGLPPFSQGAPTFVDLEGDGDQDLFIGAANGFSFYRNTGSSTAPVFTSEATPITPTSTNRYLFKPVFVDIDNDGDKDAFIGYYDNDYFFTYRTKYLYYKNTGNATSPSFTLQSEGDNPMNNVIEGDFQYDNFAFADIDGDNDKDLFVGTSSLPISYYRNTGTATAPTFVKQSSANSPYGTSTFGTNPSPTFADIDDDGDMDAFFGNSSGTIRHTVNNTINLPLKLIAFSGSSEGKTNLLNWQTADEVNTKDFEIESAIDGINFATVATIPARGSGENKYSYSDYKSLSDKVFYRLKMNDIDGKFTHSQIIWIESTSIVNISVYPNPVVKQLFLKIGNPGLQNTDVRIYDMNGKLTLTQRLKFNDNQIEVQKLQKGMYLIRFADGMTRSFVKQ